MNIVTPSEESLWQAIEVLQAGSVVTHATETCYGFACDLTNLKAVARLFSLKKRPINQPVSVLFSSLEQVKEYVVWNERTEELAHKHLPGPLTIILLRHPAAPHLLFTIPPKKRIEDRAQRKEETSGKCLPATSYQLPATLGIRLSSHPLAQELVSRFGKPLSTTSANIHGKSNPYSAQDVFEQFLRERLQPNLIIDSGLLPANPPSTVIDLTTGEKTLLRRGDLCL